VNIKYLGNVPASEIQQGSEESLAKIGRAALASIEVYETSRQLDLLMFGITGYDDDPRTLFDIPEVREWTKLLRKLIPWITDLVEPMTLSWLLPCKDRFIEEMFATRRQLLNILAKTQEEFNQLADAASERFRNARFAQPNVESQGTLDRDACVVHGAGQKMTLLNCVAAPLPFPGLPPFTAPH